MKKFLTSGLKVNTISSLNCALTSAPYIPPVAVMTNNESRALRA